MGRRGALMVLGAAYYLVCVGTRGLYRGHQHFYSRAQKPGLFGRSARAALTAPPSRLVIDYENLQASRERDRISPMAAAEYADDSLAGYADAEFAKGGETLHDQQRSLALPLIERAARELQPGSVLVEIGTGNGDVAAHLAGLFSSLEIVGVDLSTAVAQRKHHADNLRFVSGYALDLLETGAVDGDIAFAASTFVVFTPRELARYCRALAERGFTGVILNEPTWGDHNVTTDSQLVSWHLERSVWHHNYSGYLRAAGFDIRTWSCEPYQPPGSSRPDVRVTLVHAHR